MIECFNYVQHELTVGEQLTFLLKRGSAVRNNAVDAPFVYYLFTADS